MKTSLSRPPTESGRGIPEIPDFELLRWIGGGAYGEVWLGRSVTGAYRAVKVVWREDFELERTFEREFEGIRLFEPISRRHHGVVDIYHVGRNGEQGFYYYVMELADDVARGQEIVPHKYVPKTLSKVMKEEGELDWKQCKDAGVELARALNHMHVNGLAHRDVKPSNVIFVDGKPKLADIGLVAGSGEMAFVGTDGYVPPEGAGTAEGDIYSLGKVLYEMSTGYDRMEFPAVPISRLESPDADKWRELNEIVCRACTPVSRNRFPSAAAMAAEIETVGRVIAPASLIPALGAIMGLTTALVGSAIAWSAWGGAEVTVDAPVPPTPIVVEVDPEPPEEIASAPPVQSTEELEKQPKPKLVWKNSYGLEFEPNDRSHVSRHAIEAKLFNTYVDETHRAFQGEVINIRDGAPGVELIRNTVAVPAMDAVAFCKWMESKDKSKGFITPDHYYDYQKFDDFSNAVDPDFSGPSNPVHIAFRCVVAVREVGDIWLESQPSGADVLFRGEKIGVTPFRRRDQLAGRVRYELKKDGYRISEVAGTIEAGEVLELHVDLQKSGAAKLGTRWQNSLEMDFVPVGDILFSAYETRKADYEAFILDTGRERLRDPGFDYGDSHPAFWVSRADAVEFCEWLTKKERKEGALPKNLEYRLPTDSEWSKAAGLPTESGDNPASRNQKILGVFPWGYEWPPPHGSGNFADGSGDQDAKISGYLDLFPATAPVGSFQANQFGIYDMAGNVWEWVADDFGGEAEQFQNFAVVRGGSWVNHEKEKLLSSCRNAVPADLRDLLYGFRPVIAKKD